MRLLFTAAFAATSLLLATPSFAASYEETFPQFAADPEMADLNEIFADMDFQTGTVKVAGELATLSMQDQFYFLGPKDAATVLEDLWGNLPDDDVLGMVFPLEATPLHDTWGMVLTYDDIGYVKDEEAAGYDYDELLASMKASTREENKYRIENGYESIELVGWAEEPHYDAEDHKLYWAKELKFGTADQNTLNYSIRALGRQGVLQLNIVGAMDQIEEVRAAAPALIEMTDFVEGQRYADFDSSVDKVAAIGIGGLIAGKVAAKAGLLATGLLFLKKFFFLLLIPFIWLKNLFTGRKNGPEA